jgi:hypothetical protein
MLAQFAKKLFTMNAGKNDNNDDDSIYDSDAYVENTTTYQDNEEQYGPDDGSDIDPNEPIGDIDLEIVGLLSNSNGRSCSVHEICGEYVRVGDVLRLKKTVVTIQGKTEEAIKLNKITDGVEGCTVAFIPRLMIDVPRVTKNINHFCIVKELYCFSASKFLREKSHRAMGMAGVVLLNEIPQSE